MSFLQSRNNLGDLENILEARDNLGLGTMAYQMHNEINIDNGNAKLSSLRLKTTENIHENFILMASNNLGDVMWRELTIGDWLNKPQSEILLSGMCNDINFVTEDVLEDKLNKMNQPTIDTLLGSELNIENVIGSNVITNTFSAIDVSTLDLEVKNLRMSSGNDVPSVLTNGSGGSNINLYPLNHTFSNSEEYLVSSAKAVSNLYSYIQRLEKNIPDDTAGFMISTNNFNDIGLDPILAVSNLGINDNLITNNLTIKDVTMSKPDYDILTEFNSSSIKDYKLLKEAGTNRLIYQENKLIHSYIERTEDYAASAFNVNELYEYVTDKLNQQMLVNNVLSEVIENNSDGTENPLRAVFRQRLRTAGVKEIAFTGSWNDLSNAPRSLSAFDNMNGNNETLFLYSKSNFNDILDKHQALINLGVSTVGITGNFEDINLPNIIRLIGENDLELSSIPGIPFLTKKNYLNEFSNDMALIRSNLGIGDIATFDKTNIEILDGNINISECIIKTNLCYLNSNISLDHAGLDKNIYLRCENSEGCGIWDTLPVADMSNLGLTILTNELSIDSNSAITPYCINRIITSNSLILGEKMWRINFDDNEMIIQKYDQVLQDYTSIHTFY